MPTIHIDVQLSPEDLLQAVAQLETDDLASFVAAVLALKARRRAPMLPEAEADLLKKINQGLPAEAQAIHADLIQKREDETLTADEHQQLLALNQQEEAIHAQRMADLAELAELRQRSLSQLMTDLGLDNPVYA